MLNLDITFCSDTKCKNKECKRNQNNYDYNLFMIKPYISMADFSKTCTERKGEE